MITLTHENGSDCYVDPWSVTAVLDLQTGACLWLRGGGRLLVQETPAAVEAAIDAERDAGFKILDLSVSL